MQKFVKTSIFRNVTAKELSQFHARKDAFNILAPPLTFVNIRKDTRSPTNTSGGRAYIIDCDM